MRNVILFSLICFILTACGDNKSNEPAPGKSPSAEDGQPDNQASNASIKITRDGEVVTAYTPNIPGVARMPEGEGKESLMLNLNSPDNAYALMGTVANAASGSYPLSDDGRGKAQIEIYSKGTELPPRLVFENGELSITLNGKKCSGKFKGNKKGMDGKDYEITGEFTNIPLISQATGETY